MSWITGILYVILAPLVGGLLSGLDRKLTARMQGRIGPPILQPFYDAGKLFAKESFVARSTQNLYMEFFLMLAIFTGALLFAGGDLLIIFFSLALTGVFFVLGGFKASSPYSFIGAQRETLQMMAYEPAVMFIGVGMYMATKTFKVAEIVLIPHNLIMDLPGFFLAFFFILTIKFRKSPFDLSTSHHAHQEIVKGITTEFSGRTLALIEIAHWYETVFVLGLVYLFFAANVFVGIAVALFVFFLQLVIDNAAARVRWQWMVASSWIVALVACGLNILWLMFRGYL